MIYDRLNPTVIAYLFASLQLVLAANMMSILLNHHTIYVGRTPYLNNMHMDPD